MRPLAAGIAAILAWASSVGAQPGVRLRAVDPKPFYRPGDTILLELRCPAGISDATIRYNPTLQDGDADIYLPEEPKCPYARFEIAIPRDFLGKNRVVVRRDSPERRPVTFEFEVRSDVPPSDLWFSTDTQNEGCNLFYVHEDPPTVELRSVLPDGTRLDLCREAKAIAEATPKENGVFAMKDGVCTLTLTKPGPLKVVASYRGLRKEWPCTERRPGAPVR